MEEGFETTQTTNSLLEGNWKYCLGGRGGGVPVRAQWSRSDKMVVPWLTSETSSREALYSKEWVWLSLVGWTKETWRGHGISLRRLSLVLHIRTGRGIWMDGGDLLSGFDNDIWRRLDPGVIFARLAANFVLHRMKSGERCRLEVPPELCRSR